MKLSTFQLFRKGIIFTKLQEDDVIYFSRSTLSIGFLRLDRTREFWPLKIDGKGEFHFDFLDKPNFECIVKMISAITCLGYEPYNLSFAGITRTVAYRFVKS
ncbi:hypothetical protein KJ969_04065 [Patescibacteria group bacterium]|nr:hypothetical protein [Patescibacteria group bacterium]MBU1922505.1 hypothetical protein [Patescibacteria group bacterium]